MDLILVGTDLSPASEAAIVQAAEIAAGRDAEVLLVYASPVNIPPPSRDLPASARQHMDARVRLNALADRFRGRGVRVQAESHEGAPDTTLSALAEERNADLLVIGALGATGIRRFLLGSVASRAMRLAPCDVLVARDKERTGFRTILIPIDFSKHSRRSIEVALDLADDDAKIEALHCWEPPAPVVEYEPIYAFQHNSQERYASVMAEAKTLLEDFRSGAVDIGFRYEEKNILETITSRAEEIDADLIIVGTHGRRGLSRWLMGSTAEETVRHAPCSVLVVR